MGLFEKIFKPKSMGKSTNYRQYFQMLSGYSPVFTSHEGGVYESELCRNAIHARATHISKLMIQVNGSAHQDLAGKLKYQPNPWQNTSQFLYRLATLLAVYNTAYIVPIENAYGKIDGYYTPLPDYCEIVDVNGEPYLRYTFSNGRTAAIEYSRCGVLTTHQMRSDFFGETNSPLRPTMDLITTQNQGIVEGVKNSAAFRFMARLANFADADDTRAKRREIVENNFTDDNNGGIILFDNQVTDIKQIDSQPFIVNAAQQRLIAENVYNHFGVSDAIMQNRYDENEWNAFYEGAIEPFAIQVSLAMTNMTYTAIEKNRGNSIILSANRLQYASNQTKLNVATQMFDRGLMNRDGVMDIFQMPHVDGGEKYYIRKEYAEVSKLDAGVVAEPASPPTATEKNDEGVDDDIN